MGNLLSEPVTEKETEEGKTPTGLLFASSSMQGWRLHMEDAHICQTTLSVPETPRGEIELADHSLFAVFDGHGGYFAAKFAAKHFVRILVTRPSFVRYATFVLDKRTDDQASTASASKLLQSTSSNLQMIQSLEQALKEAFLQVDVELLQTLESSHNDNSNDDITNPLHNSDNIDEDREVNVGNSGTTAVVVLLTPTKIFCANAGDSRSLYSKVVTLYNPPTKTNKLTHRSISLSYDHKPNDEHEHSRIVSAGGFVTDNRVDGDLAVSRGLGDFRFKSGSALNADKQKVSSVPDVTIQTRNHEEDECVILACDGIWDVCTNAEVNESIHQMVSEGERRPGLMCEEIMDTCLMKGSKDNMTVSIILMHGFKDKDGEGNQKSILDDQVAGDASECNASFSSADSCESTSPTTPENAATALTEGGWQGGFKRSRQKEEKDDTHSPKADDSNKPKILNIPLSNSETGGEVRGVLARRKKRGRGKRGLVM